MSKDRAVLRYSWALYWRVGVYTMITTFVVGAMLGLILAAAGVAPEELPAGWEILFFYGCNMFVTFWVMDRLLSEPLGRYSVVIEDQRNQSDAASGMNEPFVGPSLPAHPL